MTSVATRPISVALFLGLLGGATISTANTLTREEQEAGWKLLFNGTDLSGWRLADGSALASSWAVVDTALAWRGNGPSAILSTETFGDFELTLDWKVGKGDDGGVYFRVADDKVAPERAAPEVQLIDNRWNSLAMEPKQSAGACVELYAPSKDATLPIGQYNTLRVVAVGGRIEHWINGERVVEYVIGSEDWNSRLARSSFKDKAGFASSPKGYLALEQGDATVRFRNVKIRPLVGPVSLAAPPRRSAGAEGRGTLARIAPMGGFRNLLGRAVAVRAGIPSTLSAGAR